MAMSDKKVVDIMYQDEKEGRDLDDERSEGEYDK